MSSQQKRCRLVHGQKSIAFLLSSDLSFLETMTLAMKAHNLPWDEATISSYGLFMFDGMTMFTSTSSIQNDDVVQLIKLDEAVKPNFTAQPGAGLNFGYNFGPSTITPSVSTTTPSSSSTGASFTSVVQSTHLPYLRHRVKLPDVPNVGVNVSATRSSSNSSSSPYRNLIHYYPENSTLKKHSILMLGKSKMHVAWSPNSNLLLTCAPGKDLLLHDIPLEKGDKDDLFKSSSVFATCEEIFDLHWSIDGHSVVKTHKSSFNFIDVEKQAPLFEVKKQGTDCFLVGRPVTENLSLTYDTKGMVKWWDARTVGSVASLFVGGVTCASFNSVGFGVLGTSSQAIVFDANKSLVPEAVHNLNEVNASPICVFDTASGYTYGSSLTSRVCFEIFDSLDHKRISQSSYAFTSPLHGSRIDSIRCKGDIVVVGGSSGNPVHWDRRSRVKVLEYPHVSFEGGFDDIALSHNLDWIVCVEKKRSSSASLLNCASKKTFSIPIEIAVKSE